MSKEVALQYDMFTGELVDTRSDAQKYRDWQREQLQQAEMFPQKAVAQFGVRANPQIPLTARTHLELSAHDSRTEEEIEHDRMKAAEASTYQMFHQDTPSPDESRIVKFFPSNLSFDMVHVDEPEPQLAVLLTDEINILFEGTRDAAYERARDTGHLAGDEVYPVGDNQLEIWKPDRSGYFLVTYSDMDMVENIQWVAEQGGGHAPTTGEEKMSLLEETDPPASTVSDTDSRSQSEQAASLVSSTPHVSNLTPRGEAVTPIYRQYTDIKAQFSEAIVLFRFGDFYEAFGADAETLARELDVVLTSRNISKSRRMPMAGIPHKAAEAYVARLIEKGYQVAVCEQVGDEPINGLIPREVVRVVTPGQPADPAPPQEAKTAPQADEPMQNPPSKQRPTWDELRRKVYGDRYEEELEENEFGAREI